MINPQQQMSFVRIVQTEAELSQQLLNLLRQEFELLKSPPSKKLEELLAQKQQQLQQIEQSVLQHNQLLASLGFDPDRKGTEAFIQQCRTIRNCRNSGASSHPCLRSARSRMRSTAAPYS